MFIKKAEFHDDSILVKKNFEEKFPKEVLGKKNYAIFYFFRFFTFFDVFCI